MKLFDPTLVNLTVCGIPITGGFAPDTFIEVRQANVDFVKIMGVDGQGTRIRTEDTSGTITIHLLQTADANAAFSAIRQQDVYSSNGNGPGPSQITDLNGQTYYSAQRSWLQKPPDGEYGRIAKERMWVIETDDLRQFIAGAAFV